MTIDELLTKAHYWIAQAEDKEMPLDEAAQCAQIAQACAQTAQAMILCNATAGYDDPSAAFKVDTGN